MSIQMDCPACMQGKHDGHDRGWGTRPGLIGGTHCGCSGDCPERLAKQAEQFMSWVRGTANFEPNHEHCTCTFSTECCYCAGREH